MRPPDYCRGKEANYKLRIQATVNLSYDQLFSPEGRKKNRRKEHTHKLN